MIKATGTLLATAIGVLFAGQALAIPITETTDAGQTLGTATTVAANTTQINGSLSNDADLFRFGWGGGAFYVSTSLGTLSDTQLFLFNSSGVGIFANDDCSTSVLSSCITATLAAGTYFLGISAYDLDPRNAANALLFPSTPFTGQPGPSNTSPLDHWSGSSGDTGTYAINFRTATTSVPEPATLSLIGAGLLGLGVLRRRRNR